MGFDAPPTSFVMASGGLGAGWSMGAASCPAGWWVGARGCALSSACKVMPAWPWVGGLGTGSWSCAGDWTGVDGLGRWVHALDGGCTEVHACLLMASNPSIHAVWMPETHVSPLFEGVFVPFALGEMIKRRHPNHRIRPFPSQTHGERLRQSEAKPRQNTASLRKWMLDIEKVGSMSVRYAPSPLRTTTAGGARSMPTVHILSTIVD